MAYPIIKTAFFDTFHPPLDFRRSKDRENLEQLPLHRFKAALRDELGFFAAAGGDRRRERERKLGAQENPIFTGKNDWFKGTNTGQSRENRWFPVKIFPSTNPLKLAVTDGV